MIKKKILSSFLSVVVAVSLFGVSFTQNSISAAAQTEPTEQIDSKLDSSSPIEPNTPSYTNSELSDSSDSIENLCTNTTQNYEDANDSVTNIYFTDDVHGNFENAKEDSGMSYATVKALKDKANTGDNKAYAVDAGDDVQGNAYANYDSGERVAGILSAVGYDFRVPGNHEFDYGMERFLNFFNSNNDYYSCNFYNGTPKERGDNVLSSYKIVDGANGQKIAFIGIMTPETITSSAPAYFKDKDGNWVKYIDDNATSAQRIYDVFNAQISAAKDGGATICIGVGHLGNENSAAEAGIDAETVVKESVGLSAFIDAHSHTPYEKDVLDKTSTNKVKIAQAASGIAAESKTEKTGINRIGKFSIDNTGNFSYKELTNDDDEVKSAGRDENVLNKERDAINYVDTELGKVVSYNDNIKTTVSKKQLRGETNNVADMVTDSIFWYTNTEKADDETIGADAAFINAGGINHKVQTAFAEKEDIKLFNCQNVLRGNYLGTAEMTGSTLREALEFSARLYPDEGNSGFLQTAGLKYYLNTDIESTVQVEGVGDQAYWVGPPTGQYRVTGIQIYDKNKDTFVDLDLDKTYKIASINYILDKLGNGYNMLKGLKVHYYTSGGKLCDYQALGMYFESFSTVANKTVLASSGSPIHNVLRYYNYPINYENPKGAEDKIKPGVAPTPDPPAPDPPTPTPDPQTPESDLTPVANTLSTTPANDNTVASTSTSDYSYATLAILMVILAGTACVIATVSRKKETRIK